jgi:hypothetical protein
MGVIEEFADETNPIYKCPSCRWVFSPALREDEILTIFGHDPRSDSEQEGG